MSKIKTLKIKCSKCGELFEFDSYESICVKEDAELKRKTVTKEIFQTHCPKCGQLHHVNFPTLYFDEDHKYLIRLVNDKSDLEDYVDTGLTKETAFANNTCRLVKDMHELVEKILIFESGLNDRAVEVVKVFVLSNGDFDRSSLRACFFAGVYDGELRFDAVFKDNKVRIAKVNMEGYQKCLEQNKDEFSLEINEWQFVNLNYGLDFMARQLNIGKQ